jgi:ribonuclease HI
MDSRFNTESLYPFPDDIVIQDRRSAIQYGRDIFERGMIERCLVVWVDASVQQHPPVRRANRLGVAAVRYLNFSSKNWTEMVTMNTLRYGPAFVIEAELIAIHEAFRMACGLEKHFDRLLIFSDCQAALQGIRSKSTFSYLSCPDLISSLFTHANMLYDLGIIAELRWIPAHSSVEGNERVDELAKRFRRSAEAILAKGPSPDLILNYVTITPGSEESLHQVFLAKLMHNKENNGERQMEMKKAYGDAGRWKDSEEVEKLKLNLKMILKMKRKMRKMKLKMKMKMKMKR